MARSCPYRLWINQIGHLHTPSSQATAGSRATTRRCRTHTTYAAPCHAVVGPDGALKHSTGGAPVPRRRRAPQGCKRFPRSASSAGQHFRSFLQAFSQEKLRQLGRKRRSIPRRYWLGRMRGMTRPRPWGQSPTGSLRPSWRQHSGWKQHGPRADRRWGEN